MVEILRFRDVERITKKSRATLYRDIKAGRLEPPVPINGSPYTVGWPAPIIEGFVQRCLTTPASADVLADVKSARRNAAEVSAQKRRGNVSDFEPAA